MPPDGLPEKIRTLMFDFHIIPGTVIQSLLADDPQSTMRVVEAAYLAHRRGQTINPDSYFLRFPEQPSNRIIALPAAIGAGFDVAGIKWIGSFPANIEQGIPRASALLVLNDQQTGYPFACLEASLISAARTAASAVLGAFWMNQQRRQVNSVAFIGAGIIARNIVEMLVADGWDLGQVGVHDRDPAYAAALADHARGLGLQAGSVGTLAAALEADMVVFATNAGQPYVQPPMAFRPGQLVLNVSLRDIAPELVLEANNLFDDVEHCMKANTSPHLAEQMSGGRSFVNGTLAELMLGEITLDRDRPLIFSPFGMGMLDLALGKHLYDRAQADGRGIAIPGFFGETSRW
jgi:N-[(2S)-2-amino-2-carboxyethyl]-L-glutamate dehydrogenase